MNRFLPIGGVLAAAVIAIGSAASAAAQELSAHLLHTLSGTNGDIRGLAFASDGRTLVSGGSDKTVKLWDVISGQALRTLAGHTDYVLSVAAAPDGVLIASSSQDHTIRLWAPATGQVVRILRGHTGYVFSVAFSPDGRTLASGSIDKTIRLWEVASGKLLTTIRTGSNSIWSMAFASNGKMLASGSYEGAVSLWDVTSGGLVRTLATNSKSVTSVAFSADGRTLASAGDDGAMLWDVASGQKLRTLETARPVTIAFAPDGRVLASGGFDHLIKLWDVASGRLRSTLTGHSDTVVAVAFAPDGRTLASGGWDNTIKLWGIEPRTVSPVVAQIPPAVQPPRPAPPAAAPAIAPPAPHAAPPAKADDRAEPSGMRVEPWALVEPKSPDVPKVPAEPKTPAERRAALVIGNSNYATFPKIPNPRNDAEDLAAALKNLGFDVLLGTDLNRADMENIFIRFAKKARESDTALVFYAGHGLQYQGINYLAPVDAKLDDETDLRKFTNLQDVIDDLQRAGHVRILIVDACRDNEAIRQLASKLPATRSAAFTRGLAAVSGADGTLIAFATQPNRVAADGAGRNSPFTQALLKNLPTPGLELRTLMTRVRAEVVAATGGAQRPEVWDSLVGEFDFKAAAQ